MSRTSRPAYRSRTLSSGSPCKTKSIRTPNRRSYEDRPSRVDPQYDIVEIRGHWVGGNCDYVAVAQLTNEDTIELIAISFDLDPLKIDFE